MLDLGRFEINRTHTVEVEAPLVVIEVRLTDPRDGERVPVRAGAKVRLIRADGTRTAFSGETDDDGFVMFAVTESLENVAVEIDFTGHEFLDLDEQVFVAANEVGLLDKRPLMRMPDVWRSDLEPDVFDALGGRFADGRIAAIEPGGQGDEVTPWEIRIDHAWTSLHVGFEHYDTEAKSVVEIDRGGVVEAFEGTSFAPSSLVGATSVHNDGVRPLRLFRAVDPASLCLRLRLPEGTFVDLTETFTPARIVASAEPVSMSTQLQRYPLPTLWLSRGQFVTTAGDGSKRTFEQAVGTAVAAGPGEAVPVVFDLDDVLLVDEDKPVAIKNAIPVTVFGRDFAVKAPDPLHAEQSTTVIDAAHLRGRDHYYNETSAADGTTQPHRVTRVIRRGRKFYNLDGTRTTQGRLIGIRRAVREAHPVVRRPTVGLKGGYPCQAEVHYFPGVGHVDLDGTEHRLGVALVFLSLRLRKLSLKVTDADLAHVREKLPLAAERWTGRPLAATFAGVSSDVPPVFLLTEGNQATKFVFHFPIVDQGRALANLFLFRTLPPPDPPDPDDHATGSIHSTHAGVFEMAIDVREDFDPDNAAGVFRESGLQLKSLVSAHELGHMMGLPDEYLEFVSRRKSIEVPRFGQVGHKTHCAYQETSMMQGNYLPMLRHHWWLAHILMKGKDPRLPAGSPVIHSDTRSLPGATKEARLHRYSLPDSDRSPFVPHRKLQFKGVSKFGATLTLLGDDYAMPTSRPDATAVLELSPKLYLRFRKRLGDAKSQVPRAERGAELQSFGEALRERFDDEKLALRLVSGGSSLVKQHLSTIHIFFAPRFSLTRFAEADLRIHYTRSTEKSPLEDMVGRKIAISDKTDKAVVLRHLFGLETKARAQIQVLTGGGGSITFDFRDKNVRLGASSSTPPGKNKYTNAIMDDVAPGATPLPVDKIAQNIADAINSDENDLYKLISARATGATVEVTRKEDAPLHIHAASTATYKITNELISSLAPSDLRAVADMVGSELGANYEVVGIP